MTTKMKSGIFLLVASVFASGVYAQEIDIKVKDPESSIRLSFGVDNALPVGSLSDGYNWMLGGSVQADVSFIQDKLYGTLNSGYNNFFGKSKVKDAHLIPVKAGLKYFFAGDFYVQGEAGVSFLVNKRHLEADKSATFVYAPQVGYLCRVGKSFIDVGARFEGNTRFNDGGDANNFVALRIAYSFSL